MPDRILTSTAATGYRHAINELFGNGTLASRPAASTQAGRRYRDEYGTVWLSDGTDWLLEGGKNPFVMARKNAVLSIPNNTYTALDYGIDMYGDAWNMHDANNASAAVRGDFVLPFKGIWSVNAYAHLSTQATGVRQILLTKGATNIATRYWPINIGQGHLSYVGPLDAGTYQIKLWQNSGGALNALDDDSANETFQRVNFTLLGSY